MNTVCAARVRTVRFSLESQCQIITSEFSRIFEVTLYHCAVNLGRVCACVHVCVHTCTSLFAFVDQLFTRYLYCEDILFEQDEQSSSLNSLV